ncbi:MAG: elongation factor P [Candidatus Omnitrophica bacterium]|nr:elongation factor P [Candidatus Omnitrophota bacterium]
MLSINQVKTGLTVLVEGNVYMVVEVNHVKPGKGSAFVRTKLRNLKTGNIQEYTFRGEEKIEEAFVDERKLAYSYRAGDMFHFIDQDNFEDLALHKDNLQGKEPFLKDNLEVSAYFYKGDLLNISLPNTIIVKVEHTEPGIKGDTAKSSGKPATIETGAVVYVPLFVNTGDMIKVDTRTGEYIERA